ncbi:MAG TPA: SulP family inorganic anion transporter, partial [Candidatus Sulfomarinibacteraceae bacterium]|nr:SulP family inorganic anion transporter [Candidatus Sulfomarinibacteraceae bacterium]
MDTPESSQTEPQQPLIEQPGLSALREAVANRRLGRLPGRAVLRQDGFAGLNNAIASVPDGLANGILAGVNPLYGLYASMAGPVAGGLFSSSKLMVITSTSAAALAAGQALAGLPAEARDNALFAMVILVGVFQVLFGLLRLGQLTRFVSYSVMTGLLAGIAVLTALSQFPTVTGYEATGDSTLARAVDVMASLGQADMLTA